MKMTIGQLRTLFREGLGEGRITASPDYMLKEKVREQLQDFIAAKVAGGEVQDEAQLDRLMNDMSLSLTALKMIPLNVWKKLASLSK